MGDNIVTLQIDNNVMKDASKTNQLLKCPKCTRTFSNVGHLKCHFYRVHSEFRLAACTINTTPPPETCVGCKKEFPSKEELNQHHCSNENLTSSNKCGKCDRVFTRKSSLFRHTARAHKRNHVCSICDKEFASKANLNAHYSTHNDDELFACDVCNAAFASEAILEKHSLTHGQIFSCKVCKRQFTRRCHLMRHSLSHKKK